MSRVIGCIGTRTPTKEQRAVCVKLGMWIAVNKHQLRSGNAEGCDQAYAEGANHIDPTAVHLCLPWPNYERQAVVAGNHVHLLEDLDPTHLQALREEAARTHKRWSNLTQGTQKLHTRNGLIIESCDLILALPNSSPWGGGTGQGMRIAEQRGIRVVNLTKLNQQELHNLCEELRA